MSPTGQAPVFRAENVTKVFRSGESDLMVLDHVNFEVAAGERLAMVGESGAGKSTLLHLLGGLDRPTSGAIYYKAKDLSGLGDSELADFRNRAVGFVWQIHLSLIHI